ncbi:MAG: hypothetical protein H7331_10515 [Bacteroidia bacterium]|nr:hypothetical protein [Bacteroidia bacterium]
MSNTSHDDCISLARLPNAWRSRGSCHSSHYNVNIKPVVSESEPLTLQ